MVEDDEEEDEEEETGNPAVSSAVEAALERLQELADDVENRPHSVTGAALRAEFDKARARAMKIFERAVLARLHADDPDVVRGRELVEREAAELWDRMQGHNNLLIRQELQQLHLQGQGLHQAAFVARMNPTPQQETMQRLFEAKSVSKLAGSTVAPKTTKGKILSTAADPKKAVKFNLDRQRHGNSISSPFEAKRGDEGRLALAEAEREWELKREKQRKVKRIEAEKRRASYLALAAKEEKRLADLQKQKWLFDGRRQQAIKSAEEERKLYLDLAAVQDKWLAADEAQQRAAASSALSPAATTTTGVAGLTRLTAGLAIGGSAEAPTAAATTTSIPMATAVVANTSISADTSTISAAVPTPSSKTRSGGLDDSGVRSPECA